MITFYQSECITVNPDDDGQDQVDPGFGQVRGEDVQVEAVLVAHQELRLRTDNVDLLSVWLVAGFLKTSRAAHFMST